MTVAAVVAGLIIVAIVVALLIVPVPVALLIVPAAALLMPPVPVVSAVVGLRPHVPFASAVVWQVPSAPVESVVGAVARLAHPGSADARVPSLMDWFAEAVPVFLFQLQIVAFIARNCRLLGAFVEDFRKHWPLLFLRH